MWWPQINSHSPLQWGAPGPHTVRVQSFTSNRHHPEPGQVTLWHLARPWLVGGKYGTEVQRPRGGRGATGGRGGLSWPLLVSISWEWQKKEALSFASLKHFSDQTRTGEGGDKKRVPLVLSSRSVRKAMATFWQWILGYRGNMAALKRARQRVLKRDRCEGPCKCRGIKGRGGMIRGLSTEPRTYRRIRLWQSCVSFSSLWPRWGRLECPPVPAGPICTEESLELGVPALKLLFVRTASFSEKFKKQFRRNYIEN